MTKNPFGKTKKEAKKVRLEKESKVRIRENVVSFIDKNPVREAQNIRLTFWSTFKINNTKLKYMAVVLAIAILLSGGVSYAAEGALPGDALYPVKVEINEEVRDWFNFSADADARWDVRLAERRLEEAGTLSAQNRLDEETRSGIESRFEERIEKIEEHLKNKRDNENIGSKAEIAIRLESSLAAHEEIIEELSQTNPERARALEALLSNVRERLQSASERRAEAEERVGQIEDSLIKPRVEAKLSSAKSSVAEAKRAVASKADSIRETTLKRLESRISLAEQYIERGESNIESGSHGEAFILLEKATQIANQVKLFVRAHVALDISVDARERRHDGDRDNEEVCVQVITYARNPRTGNVEEFSTPCDVPDGWEIVRLHKERDSRLDFRLDAESETRVETQDDREESTEVEAEGSLRLDVSL